MAVFNRKPVRQKLAALLESELTGQGKPAQAVYRSYPPDFDGQSPVVIVGSSGSQRKPAGIGSDRDRGKAYFDILLFVAAADPKNGWTADMVEDALDDLECAVAGVISRNSRSEAWTNLTYADQPTEPSLARVGGAPYWMERIRLVADIIAQSPTL